ncbi:arginine vasopressin-induced protein 1 isoform X4 [Canis lupus baileyi]|nr:arginine vasopressin-induced protein 1 isoform X2 [Canis lupus familiaris]XP_038316181.1 arginine vasopressin-induced protein 1 isoform X2 [Canis lupus familiaris]XP_038434378.1 arginine vasopressin-induced protein 1 isoform X2 [Canis lupus familiaris]
MGTPASVVSEPPLWQAPAEARGRKQASANIFQDAELLQIQGLFQRSGDQLAEERAQIIWECAGDHRVAEALRRLRRKRPPRLKPLAHSLHHCSRLRWVPGTGRLREESPSPALHWPTHRVVARRQLLVISI